MQDPGKRDLGHRVAALLGERLDAAVDLLLAFRSRDSLIMVLVAVLVTKPVRRYVISEFQVGYIPSGRCCRPGPGDGKDLFVTESAPMLACMSLLERSLTWENHSRPL